MAPTKVFRRAWPDRPSATLRRVLLEASLALLVAASAACWNESGGSPGTGGSVASGGRSGVGGSGGASGTAGTSSTGGNASGGDRGSGGTSASGGTSGGAGGSGGTGGGGTGGTARSGGTTGSGGTTTGGTTGAGGTTATGGAVTGGTTSTGGMRTGGTTGTTTGGAGGGGAGRDGGQGGGGGSGGVGGTGGTSTGTGGTRPDGGGADGPPDVGDAGSGFQPCPTTAGTACAIMPLGDSITEGCCTAPMGGYRIELYRQVLTNKKNLTFVGTASNGPDTVDNQPFPKKHEGHGGYTIAQIAGLADNAIATSKPHIVLLKIGTNDINGNVDVANAPNRLASLIDQITKDVPSALLVVSAIIPTTNDGTNQRVQSYNTAIKGKVDGAAAAGKHVVFVDNYALFTQNASYKTALMADGLHPNTAGYVALGQSFYKVIGTFLPAKP